MRCFIALQLAPEVQNALAEIQNELKRPLPQARWTRPQGTHLTLKFLGEVLPNQIPSISGALDRLAPGYQPFSLSLINVGAFPRLAAPRVLWVGIGADEVLMRLQANVEATLSPLGFPTEERAFKPHLTLARLNGEPWSQDLRQAYLDCQRFTAGINWPINQVVLFKSDLQPKGAIYTAIHQSRFLS